MFVLKSAGGRGGGVGRGESGNGKGRGTGLGEGIESRKKNLRECKRDRMKRRAMRNSSAEIMK